MQVVPHWITKGFDGVVGFLPNLIGGLITLVIGYIVASVLRRIARPLLHRAGFDRLMYRLGMADPYDAEAGSRTAATAVFVVAIVATLMQVARTWNLTFVAAGLAAALAYLPHVLGAVVISAQRSISATGCAIGFCKAAPPCRPRYRAPPIAASIASSLPRCVAAFSRSERSWRCASFKSAPRSSLSAFRWCWARSHSLRHSRSGSAAATLPRASPANGTTSGSTATGHT